MKKRKRRPHQHDVPATFPVDTAYPASEEEFKKAFEMILDARKQKQLQKEKNHEKKDRIYA